jgi:TonB family protein
MRSVRLIALGITFALALLACATEPVTVRPPKPAADFPNSDSFYPIEALRNAQEGRATLHVCLDPQGKLSAVPSIAESSGNSLLDAAAIQVGTATSGHYIPATKNGANVSWCGMLPVKFALRVDPRWPTLSRKLNLLNAEFRIRVEALRAEVAALAHPPGASQFIPGNPEHLMWLRQESEGTSGFLDDFDDMVTRWIDRIERLSSSDDIPESERNAWAESWPARRAAFEQIYRQFRSAGLDLVDIGTKLGDYVENAHPPLIGPSGPVTPTPQQRSELDTLMNRGRAADQRMLETSRALSLSAKKLTFPD